jgi:hypothetical protein
VISEVRTYTIKRGMMESWVRHWREAMEHNIALGIRVEWAGFDPESMGTFVFIRSFRNEEERRRLEEAFYEGDWWRSVSDEVMSHVLNWESRLFFTAAARGPGGELADTLQPDTVDRLFPPQT